VHFDVFSNFVRNVYQLSQYGLYHVVDI